MKTSLLAVGVLALSHGAFAQQPPPTAGGQLQQIPPAPVPERAAPEIIIEKRGAPPRPAGEEAKVVV
ncbi:MAG TPA: ShlB/FhaC/HecB family hemolysin secretion/activation protein, partial [Burkholderiales bacterium]|nr:ShlB/FhaC/HecB family hemolysin secretion/activation protein [Burkholderiales bacterium]